jgi:hypothetical protein
MDQFLGHTTKSGGGSQFLRGWRKRTVPAVNIVLHTGAPIVALWQHGIPRIFEKKDEKTGEVTRVVFGGNWNCLEDESVLVKQYRRDRDTGERVLPPVVCPVCRLLEALRILYADGQIGFADDVFRWEGDDPKDVQVLTLGGMLNLYGNARLSDAEKEAMRDAGIKLTEAWKENAWSKCNYLFTVVDSDEPEAGIQIAIETTGLGDATKECIHSQIVSEGEERGNPLVTPYVIKWEHHPNAKEFNKKYKAYPVRKIPITPQVLELIESDPPDIDNLIRGGNVSKLRAELEARCVLIDPGVIPWDDIFGPAEAAGYGDKEDEETETEEEAPPPPPPPVKKKAEAPAKAKSEAPPTKPAAEPALAATGRKRKEAPKPEPEPEPEVEAETIPCDECGAPMSPSATKCEKCGAEYEVEPDESEAHAKPEPPAKPAKPASKPAVPAATDKPKKKLPF